MSFVFTACDGGRARLPPATARHALLITIDTLRVDHVGAYGWSRARTPTLDRLAREGVMFDRAYAAAPITLPSHATMLTGRYPPGHGSRDNGMKVSVSVPTVAAELRARGVRTAAFVAAFPLDHQFGLDRGFEVYSDRMPRNRDGSLANERPASQVVTEAIDWLRTTSSQQFFVWVHLFEPHAPYGSGASENSKRPVLDRYDDEIATVDHEVGRLVDALGSRAGDTLIVVAGDHGEAFGEHGEFAHSIFVYDTTLRVPLVIAGSLSRRGAKVTDPVTLADLAPTMAAALGLRMKEVDGIDLTPALSGSSIDKRELYAESFAPLVEFGWAPLRSVRSEGWKYIAAPRPELYDIERDPDERIDARSTSADLVRRLDARVSRYSAPVLPQLNASLDPTAAERLRALGYTSGARNDDAGARPDPKDRREMAARIAQVTSGELSGSALVLALEAIVRDDPRNGQAHLRLAFAQLQRDDCAHAEPEFHAAIAAGLPSADAYQGLATCLGRRRDLTGAGRALAEARRLEPDNPTITANIGILQATTGNLAGAIESLQSALKADPDLHEARFNLALAYARAGRRSDAIAAATELLNRLPPDAPQRSEVERLRRTLR